ncbi:MAG: hypothetical protein U0804_04935 [Gemmataceae bacterium]
MAAADTIAIKCPGCQAGFDVPTSLAGKTIRCTSCKTQLPVPAGRGKSAGDALPTAKTAPARGSNGPPAKSAADMLPKGKPSRRRDDDDEDDEDDDDRPRRKGKKKAASGGGSAMPLILAGVGVVVLAGGGIGAYFAFKKDTPVASSGSSGTTTPPADGGSKGGPPRGMTPPGGGEAAWQPFTGDGFTVEMPGTPNKNETQNDGGTTTRMNGLLSPDETSAFIVVAATLPPEARAVQPRMMLDLMLTGLEKSSQKQTRGSPFRFGAQKTERKLKVAGKRETIVDGNLAYDVDFAFDPPGGVAVGKLVAAGGKLIVLIAGHETDASFAPQGKRFIDSLKFTAGSGGENVAANTPNGPDGGGPGKPTPRGGGADGQVTSGGPPAGMTFPGGGPPAGMGIPGPGGPPAGMTFPGGGGPPAGMTFPGGGGPPPGMGIQGPGGPPPGMVIPGAGGPPPGMGIPGRGGPPPGMGIPGGPPPGMGIQGPGAVPRRPARRPAWASRCKAPVGSTPAAAPPGSAAAPAPGTSPPPSPCRSTRSSPSPSTWTSRRCSRCRCRPSRPPRRRTS